MIKRWRVEGSGYSRVSAVGLQQDGGQGGILLGSGQEELHSARQGALGALLRYCLRIDVEGGGVPHVHLGVPIVTQDGLETGPAGSGERFEPMFSLWRHVVSPPHNRLE